MEFLSLNTPSIRQVSSVIGTLASRFPGVMNGPMFYRCFEFDKTQALKYSRGNFERSMNLSDKSTILVDRKHKQLMVSNYKW